MNNSVGSEVEFSYVTKRCYFYFEKMRNSDVRLFWFTCNKSYNINLINDFFKHSVTDQGGLYQT